MFTKIRLRREFRKQDYICDYLMETLKKLQAESPQNPEALNKVHRLYQTAALRRIEIQDAL